MLPTHLQVGEGAELGLRRHRGQLRVDRPHAVRRHRFAIPEVDEEEAETRRDGVAAVDRLHARAVPAVVRAEAAQA